VLLIFDFVAGQATGTTAAVIAAALLLGLWVLLPLIVRKSNADKQPGN